MRDENYNDELNWEIRNFLVFVIYCFTNDITNLFILPKKKKKIIKNTKDLRNNKSLTKK